MLKNLVCDVLDQNSLSRELIMDFIRKTEGLSLREAPKTPIDLVFVDEDLDGSPISLEEKHFQIVVISANAKYVYLMFKNKIADYIHKPNLTYERFLKSIEKVRARKEP